MPEWKQFVSTLDARKPLPYLQPADIWDAQLSQQILSSKSEDLLAASNADDLIWRTVQAGLLQWNDDLSASHEIVQDIHTIEGSYWHGIMHRREGDYNNAKYWFSNVKTHPIHETLYKQAVRLWPECEAWSHWSHELFVDCVQRAVEEGEDTSPQAEALRRIQVVEFSLLLRHVL